MFTKADIEKYFMAEKTFGLVFAIVGIAAVVAALLFYFSLKTNFYKGAAVPLLLTGLLFDLRVVGGGFAILLRSLALPLTFAEAPVAPVQGVVVVSAEMPKFL